MRRNRNLLKDFVGFCTFFDIQDAVVSVLAHRISLKASIKYLKTPTEFIIEAFERFLDTSKDYSEFAVHVRESQSSQVP